MKHLHHKHQRYRRLSYHQRGGIRTAARIAIRRIAARSTRIQFGSFADHDASGLAVVGAFAL